MCDCVKEINAELAKHNTKLSWAFTMMGRTHLLLQTEVVEKKRGAKAMNVFPSYCPFCGEKYQSSEEVKSDERVTQ